MAQTARTGVKSRIGEILVKMGVIEMDTLQKALSVQWKDPNRKLGDILVNDLGSDHHAVFSQIAKLYAFKELDLEEENVDDERIKFITDVLDKLSDEISQALREKYIIPFRLVDDLLVLITPDPSSKDVTSLATRCGFRKFDVFYSRKDKIEELLEKLAPETENDFLEMVEQASEDLEEIETEETEVDEEALDAEINQSMLTKVVEAALIEGVRQGASDIHIVPKEGNVTDFSLRVDGKIRIWYSQKNTKSEAVSAVVKDRTLNVDRFERERRQDGFIQRMVDGNLIRYRVSIMPIVTKEFEKKFESIVIRIIDDRNVIKDLEKLGLLTQAREDFNKAIRKPQGMVILTGPTGSGKSTTLNAALYQVIDPTLNVITVEEPVEFLIDGARQLKMGDKLDFDDAIKGILRHDPDIVLVGEMRDTQTAMTGIKLANTGHLTFSTLHTNDAASSVSRLFKMDVEPFLIANAINIILAQRLMRRLCGECKRPMENSKPEVFTSLGLDADEWKDVTIYEAVGCDVCTGSGYKGRAGIHEALYFYPEIRQIILKSGSEINEALIVEAAQKRGMLTLRESAIERVRRGESTFDEVVSMTTEE